MSSHPVEIDQFAELARAFLAWCDSSHEGKTAQLFHHQALQQLSGVYSAALSLPGVEGREAPDPPRISPEKRSALAKSLAALPLQYYWEIFTPSDLDGDKEPVCGDLFDDFIDIYADLSEGLWLYDRQHLEMAVFTWRLMFGAHWGRHAVSAMHALHSYEPGDSAEGLSRSCANHPSAVWTPTRLRGC
jgi:hypothetical protein